MNIEQKAKRFIEGKEFTITRYGEFIEWTEKDKNGNIEWIYKNHLIAKRKKNGDIKFTDNVDDFSEDTIGARIGKIMDCLEMQKK